MWQSCYLHSTIKRTMRETEKNMQKQLNSLRCTVFVPQFMSFSLDFAKKMMELFGKDDYVPVIMPNQLPELGQVTPEGFVSPISWQLVQSDKKTAVYFVANKIDIICFDPAKEWSDEQKFIEFCSQKFEVMRNYFPRNYSRIAYAPSYVFNFVSESNYITDILKNTTFEDTEVATFAVNNTFLKNEIIDNKEIWLNYVINISSQKKSSVNIQLDINTNSLKKNNFESKEVKSFFANVQFFSQKAIKLYMLGEE